MLALVCPRCGAPLPVAAAGSHFSTCAYCDVTVQLSGGSATIAREPAAPVDRREDVRSASARFVAAVQAALGAGVAPYDAVRSAAAANLGVFGQSDTVARVAVAIADDFDRANKTTVSSDAMALARIAEAYLKTLDEIRANGQATLNLPFLTATAAGPLHLQRVLSPAELLALANRPLPAPKKKGWLSFF